MGQARQPAHPTEDMRPASAGRMDEAGQRMKSMCIQQGDDLAGRRQDDAPGAAGVVLHQRPGIDAPDQPKNEIGPGELSDFIHEFHGGWARGVYKTHSVLKPDQLVARALGIGLLRGDEVSEGLRHTLTDAITYYREHYAIDENDPLSQLRR